MYEKNLVICDREQQYAKNLLERLSGSEDMPFRLYLFHSIQELTRFAAVKPVNILLISAEYGKEERAEITADQKFVLVKDPGYIPEEDEKTIYRYQSADDIRENLLEGTVTVQFRKKDTAVRAAELIGIYSPIHRIGKTRFALDMGKKLAEEGPTLYLNLEEYAGGRLYFPEKTGKNLGDLLYYIRQEKGKLAFRISTMTGQMGKLDYLEPIPYVEDFQAVTEEEWLDLLEMIQRECIYKKIILDLGDSVSGLFRILQKCTTIYTPYIEEGAARAKLTQYTENLRKTGKEDILEKTIQKKMVRQKKKESGIEVKRGLSS